MRQGNPPGKHAFFNPLLCKIVVFGLQTTFFDSFNVFFNFLAENNAERSRNYLKKQVLEPECAVLLNKCNKKSSGY